MAILYITEQGASLTKQGNRLVVEKLRKTIQWVTENKHRYRVGTYTV